MIKQNLINVLPARWIGAIRAWRVRRAIRAYSPRLVEHRYGAASLRVWLVDPLAEGWYDRDWPELPEIAALRRTRLEPGARVFDLGAHQGVVAMMLSRAVGAAGTVVAVEASPHNAAVVRRNCEVNGIDNITIIQAAVSERNGTLVFNENLNGQLDDGSGVAGSLTVNSLTIDELALRYGVPGVLFIDIEGAECLALEGAARVLDSAPDFFIEVHVGCGLEKLGGSIERLFSYFPSDRFTILGRAESESEFHPIVSTDAITKHRFYFLALSHATPGK